MYTNRYSQMVQEYYVRRLRAIMAERAERLNRLKTRAQAQAYVRRVRAAVRRCFAPFPKRTPLNPVITGRDEYRPYVLEKVVFESRPGFLVTGNLLLPKGRTGKCPAVLGVCGHSVEGKAAVPYQSFAQGLAVKGFVVFLLDPISQGERFQFYRKDGAPRPPLTQAHTMMGTQMTLVGDFFGTWRVWDAMRGLDYLLSRPEVDRSRVGVTGNSGGGTLSTYVTALDPRVTMAAPSCFICSYLANMENELSADAEQNPPGIIGAGLDHVDMLLCYAPRPTLILGQQDDYFDARYVRKAGEDLKRVHALLGSRGTAEVFVGPRGHGYHVENREAMYAWFMKHAGLRGTARERGVKIVDAKRLYATPRGETHRAGSRRVFEFTAERAGALAKRRGRPAPGTLQAAARRLLGLRQAKGAPPYRVLIRWARQNDIPNRQAVFAVESEPGILVYVASFGRAHPFMHAPTGKVTLYVGHTSGEEDVGTIRAVRALNTPARSLVVVDPRGIGQSRPQAGCARQASFDQVMSADYFHAAAGDMLGESVLGRRVFDVMRAIDFLCAGGATDITLMGRGLGSITVAFAALLHPCRPRARLLHYLPSYQSIVDSPLYAWPLSAFPRGVLKHFDLPDVYRALGRRFTRTQPWNAHMKQGVQ
ncbi:MAG: acetylxylan esterase [Kiritimatiellae bacterium]|nr:acetylxylan esterase [Kiritimatiellia bacterium]